MPSTIWIQYGLLWTLCVYQWGNQKSIFRLTSLPFDVFPRQWINFHDEKFKSGREHRSRCWSLRLDYLRTDCSIVSFIEYGLAHCKCCALFVCYLDVGRSGLMVLMLIATATGPTILVITNEFLQSAPPNSIARSSHHTHTHQIRSVQCASYVLPTKCTHYVLRI